MGKTARILAVLAVFVFVFSVCGAADKEEGLVGYWSFDEGKGEEAADASGSGNKGTLIEEPTWIKGIKGSALSFEGSGDYVEVEHSESLDLGREGQSYAIAFWYKNANQPQETTDSHFIIKDAWPYPFTIVQRSGSTVGVWTYDKITASSVGTKKSVIDGKWHYIVCMRDGARKKLILYLDGKLEDAGDDKSEGDLNNEGVIKIGFGPGLDFDGCLDEVKIYNRLLTKEEMASYYKSLNPNSVKANEGK